MRLSKIQKIIIGSFTVTVFTIVLAIMVVVGTDLAHQLVDRQVSKVTIITQNLAFACADALLAGEVDQLKKMVTALKESDPEATSIIIENKTGMVVSASDEKLINQTLNVTDRDKEILASNSLQLFHDSNYEFESSIPIFQDKTLIGYLRLHYTQLYRYQSIFWSMAVIAGISILCAGLGGFGYIWFMDRMVVSRICDVNSRLIESSNHIITTGHQISTSAFKLADDAGSQTDLLQKSSSATEEITSMTKRNAENALTAKDLANHTRQAAELGAEDMVELNKAMDAIKASSDSIVKIIKSIDEIAFQAKILALNAAVEAARAGDSGLGFAVVADEFRNLAQLSAQAAHETSEKIQDSIVKSTRGVEISSKVGDSLKTIVQKAREVDELVAQIAVACNEQSTGLEQVNASVSQLDQVTQSNAANAEEGYAVAEELNSHAGSIKMIVEELGLLVSRNKMTSRENPEIKLDWNESKSDKVENEIESWETSEPVANGHGKKNGHNNGGGKKFGRRNDPAKF